jgi:DMSO/TMAO reductase YedYZ molybdopterin-dependent catalytic subunit
MKLDRRAFIRSIPVVALAAACGSLWFLGQAAKEPIMTSRATATTSVASPASPTASVVSQTGSTASVALQPTSTTPEAFDFPVTWNGDQSTKVDTNEYRLRIDGDVSKPLELTLEDLYAMSNVQKTVEIQCVEGWAATVLWEGIPLSYLLGQAGASLKKIASVKVESITGYTMTISSDEAANPDDIIALKAGGAPLTVEHGYPARLVAPMRPGLHWVKYVGRITCTNK